jgi:hypothetical protein
VTADKIVKLLTLLAFLVVVGGLTWLVYERIGAFPATRVAHQIAENAAVAKLDLKCGDEDDLVGRYTLREMRVGEIIGTQNVANEQHAIRSASLALMAPMKIPAGRTRVDAGERVRLCLGHTLVKDDAEVQATVCDSFTCVLTVAIDALPKDLAPTGSVKDLKAIQLSEPCQDK